MQFKMIHENYNVRDLGASLAFYEKALGLTERRRKEGNKNQNSHQHNNSGGMGGVGGMLGGMGGSGGMLGGLGM